MSAKEEIAISVSNISKSFKLPHEKTSSVKALFVNLFKGRRSYETQHVLKSVSFEVKKGEFFGIVGRNGSGKSTLLKLLAGIYSPDKGNIQVNGKLTPFIELGVGFNPELTGRENVYLNGALLGFSRKEMEAMYDEIVEFAELKRFMDQKLKNYSSGMQVRLAFSIAIRANTDILVLDEVLAVGDEAFQRKCFSYFEKLKKEKKTVVLVTHDMESVKKYCTSAIMINEGEVTISGSPEDVANEYSVENNQQLTTSEGVHSSINIVENLEVSLLSPKIIDEKTPVKINVKYKTTIKETGIYICLVDIDRGVPLYDCPLRQIKESKVNRNLSINITEINNANIKVLAAIRDSDNNTIGYITESQTPKFLFRRKDHLIRKPTSKYGIINNYGKWD